MKWIKRVWTPMEADEWTKEDWMVIVLSPTAYILIAVGVAGTFLLQVWGYISLVIGVIVIIIMHWIINPKLSMISSEFEKHQKEYLVELEKKARWEENNG